MVNDGSLILGLGCARSYSSGTWVHVPLTKLASAHAHKPAYGARAECLVAAQSVIARGKHCEWQQLVLLRYPMVLQSPFALQLQCNRLSY